MHPARLASEINRVLNKIDDKNRTLFYIVMAVLILALITILVLAMEGAEDEQKRVIIDVISKGAMLIGLIFMMTRQQKNNEYQHLQHHDRRNSEQAVVLNTELANQKIDAIKNVVDEAKKEVVEAKKEIVETKKEMALKLNGGLHSAVQDELKKSPYPTSTDELIDFVKKVQPNCDAIADAAVQKTIQTLKDSGQLKC